MGTITNSIENFQMIVNQDFVDKAESLKPTLRTEMISAESWVKIEKDEDWCIAQKGDALEVYGKPIAIGDSVCLDFGNHCVGYVTLYVSSVGSPPDAPAHIRIKLGETLCEIGEDSADYHGSISSSWIQEEFLHVDVLPTVIRMPRRYAFRYMEVKVVDTSPKYQLVIDAAFCETVTSADRSKVKPLPIEVPQNLRKMDEVAQKTLEDCMQLVFEDGPKRDRRLWIGDLRLQALVNYVTFQNNDLVKRCLYLFAGLLQNENRVGACLFIEPKLQVDDTALFDYSLFFVSCLYDYYMETQDIEPLKELWNTAYEQLMLANKRLQPNGVVADSDDWWCFLDWCEGLNKQAGAQGVFLCTLRQGITLAGILNLSKEQQELEAILERVLNGAREYLWNEEKGFFESGSNKQISWASQVWLVLGNVFDKQKNKEILMRLQEEKPSYGMVTPYMYHHLIDAMMQNDMVEEAFLCMDAYWGKMVEEGADCFYELFNPENPKESPYGSRIINSYCHAWSCTPSYFIRKYYQ